MSVVNWISEREWTVSKAYDDAWQSQRDDVLNVAADLDPPSARIQYAFLSGWQARDAEVAQLHQALTLISRGTWTAKNSIDTITYIAREALALASQQNPSL